MIVIRDSSRPYNSSVDINEENCTNDLLPDRYSLLSKPSHLSLLNEMDRIYWKDTQYVASLRHTVAGEGTHH